MATRVVPALGEFHVPAFGPLTSTRIKTLGIIGLLLLAQLFIFLGMVVNVDRSGNSDLLPSTGNWSGWEWSMVFYIFMTLGAMILVNYTPDVSVVPKAKDISRFLINYSLWTFITWGLLTLIFPHGTGVAALTGTFRIQQFVFTSLFVAPTEELMFRVVLPRVLNSWILGSTVAFVIFHLSAYSTEYASDLLSALTSLIILSVVLWAVYAFQIRFKTKSGEEVTIAGGYGASTGAHAAYDLVVLGVLGPLLRGFGLAIL
jgi:hypothetical protein